jgi:hypothetical protein
LWEWDVWGDGEGRTGYAVIEMSVQSMMRNLGVFFLALRDEVRFSSSEAIVGDRIESKGGGGAENSRLKSETFV